MIEWGYVGKGEKRGASNPLVDKVGTDQTKTAAAEAEVPVDESSWVGGWEA